MSANTIDYDAIAKKYGGTSSAPQPQGQPQAPGASQGAPQIDYDAIAQKYGATSSQPQENLSKFERGNAFKREAWGNAWEHVKDFEPIEAAKDVGSLFSEKNPAAEGFRGMVGGAGKSAMRQLARAADIASFGTNHEEFEDIRKEYARKNEAEKGGEILLDVSEFALGSGVFKALSKLPLAKRIFETKKILEAAKGHPTLTKIIMEAIEGGTVGGTIGGLNADEGKVIKGAAEGAAIGGLAQGGLAAAGEGIAAGARALKKTPKVVGSLVDSVVGKPGQTELQAGIRNAATETAREAEVTVAETSIRNTVRETSKSVKAKADKLYAEIDAVTDSRFSNTDNALRDARKALRRIKGSDDVAEERIAAKIATLEGDLIEVTKMAENGGVDPSVAEAARNTYKQSMALRDVDKAVQSATVGDVSVGEVETVKPSLLANKLQALYNKGRLQEAFGEKGAKAILADAYKAKDAAASRAKNIGRAKTVGKYVGIPAAAGMGLGGLKALAGDD
jgi:hypothetical protein